MSRDTLQFLLRAVREPMRVGAIAPSSPRLARELASVVPSPTALEDTASRKPVVVELGPGTGAVSKAVGQRLDGQGRHIAIELDSGMARHLRERFPELEVIEGNAAELETLLAEAGVEQVDAVISGLPWALIDDRAQRDILRQVGRVLAPQGAFTTFAYTHALGMAQARIFRHRLGMAFDEVLTSRTVWRNVPPARIYACRRPKRG